jgi:hypothetical protein
MKCHSRLRLLTVASIVFLLNGAGWTQEKLAIPEFFGLYASDGGRGVALHEGQATTTATRTVQMYSIPKTGLWSNAVPEISSSVRFILFYSDAGEMVQAMTLHRLPLVRNILATPEPPYGGAPKVVSTSNQPLLARIPELEFRILSKPVPNQPQMIELAASPRLSPGLYLIDYDPKGKTGWTVVFSVTSSAETEKQYCVDLILPGGYWGAFERANSELSSTAPLLTNKRYRSCDAGPSSAPGPARTDPAVANINNGSPGSAPAVPSAARCSDYDACSRAGNKAFEAANWPEALADFQTATSQRPSSANAWMSLGIAYLAIGRTNELASAWDQVLKLGQPIGITVCHQRSFQPCESGLLWLRPNTISFVVSGRTLFSVPPSEVEIKRFGGDPVPWAYISLRAASKNYTFYPFPVGVQCPDRGEAGQPICPPQGVAQQLAMVTYIAHTIQKLGSGTLVGTAKQE